MGEHEYQQLIRERRHSGPTACVVGNSPSLLGKRQGWLIDHHQYVVRCNLYTAGYDADAGHKVTHWAFGMCRESVAMLRDYGLPQGVSEDTECWCFTVRKGMPSDRPEWYDVLRLRPSILLERSWANLAIRTQQGFIEADIDIAKRWPTTGLMAIGLALKRWRPPISLVGFNTSERVSPGHYWGPDQSTRDDEIFRAFNRDRLLINYWVRQGLLRRLDDDG